MHRAARKAYIAEIILTHIKRGKNIGRFSKIIAINFEKNETTIVS